MIDAHESLERAIAGALRAAIHDHGPITADKIGSAAKRVAGNLKNVRVDGLGAGMGTNGTTPRPTCGRFAPPGSPGRSAE
jgi:hypothetical protein